MIIIIYATLGIAAAILTVYFVRKSKEFRKFLSGAFFVSGGIQLYLSLANVSIPLLGTDLVQTPEIGGIRCIPHFIFSGLCFYYGFVQKPKIKSYQ
jgi:hypothetical protein